MGEQDGRLQGKRAVVTGAGSGIGQAVAIRFASEGARVGLIGRRVAALEETAATIRAAGGTCLVTPCDVSDETQVEAAIGAAVREFGGLDSVVGVAGVELIAEGDGRVDQLELANWRRTIDINLTGMFLTCKHGTRALLANGGGTITITGSPCGLFGHCAGEHAYSASKAGTHGLVRVMAADLAAEHIRVNCVIPGFIDTPINAPVMADPAWLAEAEAGIPMKRAGRSDEVAPLYVWLASDDSSYVTGAFFTADGGQTAV
jgi:NAD(P)-dependent dehydrogenase (short-subunit alcohol dehydrogenase family)